MSLYIKEEATGVLRVVTAMEERLVTALRQPDKDQHLVPIALREVRSAANRIRNLRSNHSDRQALREKIEQAFSAVSWPPQSDAEILAVMINAATLKKPIVAKDIDLVGDAYVVPAETTADDIRDLALLSQTVHIPFLHGDEMNTGNSLRIPQQKVVHVGNILRGAKTREEGFAALWKETDEQELVQFKTQETNSRAELDAILRTLNTWEDRIFLAATMIRRDVREPSGGRKEKERGKKER